ncbi:MAG TPA: tetratricopeptide repeat protein [Tepidisphaeraceae bacterium]|nr:tetratricopeptide repeat protein [Tepidisphaeraceae bacterium]
MQASSVVKERNFPLATAHHSNGRRPRRRKNGRAAGAGGAAWAGALALLLLILCTGCANQQRQEKIAGAVMSFHAGDYPRAIDTLKPMAEKPDEDFVLNNLRLGSTALAAQDFDEAENAFLRAVEVINATGVNDGGRTLGAVLVDEKIKIWKGEPFERAMASFYLGVVYYARQDYQNARASFENALFKLRDADPDKPDSNAREVDSNFALASLMLAKSYQRLGRDDLAKANFEFVARRFPQLAPLASEALNASSNLLLVVDYGYGPRKVTDFDGAMVGFGPTPMEEGPLPRPIVRVDGREVPVWQFAQPPVDLLALAQDRKWQSIDTIRTVKSAIGTGLLVGGAVEGLRGVHGHGARQRTDLMVAGALIGTGLLLKATSQADVRQWEMLPRTTYVLPLRVEPGTRDVTVEFPRNTRQVWQNLVVPATGEATYYMKMQRWNQGPFVWPPREEISNPQSAKSETMRQ